MKKLTCQKKTNWKNFDSATEDEPNGTTRLFVMTCGEKPTGMVFKTHDGRFLSCKGPVREFGQYDCEDAVGHAQGGFLRHLLGYLGL